MFLIIYFNVSPGWKQVSIINLTKAEFHLFIFQPWKMAMWELILGQETVMLDAAVVRG